MYAKLTVDKSNQPLMDTVYVVVDGASKIVLNDPDDE